MEKYFKLLNLYLPSVINTLDFFTKYVLCLEVDVSIWRDRFLKTDETG